MKARLIWVNLPYACYGILTTDGKVTFAPPIARWMVGRSETFIAAWIKRKGGRFVDLGEWANPAGDEWDRHE